MSGRFLHPLKRPNIESVNLQLHQSGLAVEYFPSFKQENHYFHTHDFVEMLFVIDGRFRHITADQTYDEHSGSLTVLNYDQYHSLRTPYGPVELMNLYWNPDLYLVSGLPEPMNQRLYELIPQHRVFGHRLNRIRHFELKDPGKMTNLLLMLYQEQQKTHEGYEASMQALFRLFLIELCRAIPLVRDRNDNTDLAMEKVRLYLDREFTETIRLDALCAKTGLNPANFCRRFKAYTGMSTGDYLKQRRLAAVLQKLRATDDKIVTVCNDCGFPDVSRFNRIFKESFGCTPSEYRNGTHI
ncbi:MAG: helix-turn-helix domain-containing protein [Spirochaetales bacterium]|nr:helix-turn-helix domain-containing protein [Spirochaetales bacterium]